MILFSQEKGAGFVLFFQGLDFNVLASLASLQPTREAGYEQSLFSEENLLPSRLSHLRQGC